MPRVGIIAFLHESNTFVEQPTTMADFERDVLVLGPAMLTAFAAAPHEVGGFIEGLSAPGVETVPIFAARTIPLGPLTAETFERLTALLLSELAAAGPLEGLLLAPHGAMVSEQHADADGHWMTRVREQVGRELPMIATLDPHANVSARMVAATDALLPYRTNPHIDQRQRGVKAARLMLETIAGSIRPVQFACFPPLAISIDCQCTDEEPLRAFSQRLIELEQRPQVLDASLILGFPYADVAEMGSAILVVTDGQRDVAEDLATELAEELWELRAELGGRYESVEAGISRAMSLPSPVCLLEMGDNVGGGGPGDGTWTIAELQRRKLGPSLVVLCDPEAVAQGVAAGVGAEIALAVGGKTDKQHGPPVWVQGTVRGIHVGRFYETEARHGGMTDFDQGPTVVLDAEHGLTIMLTSLRMAPVSLNQLSAFGIDAGHYRFIVAKGVNAPLAAYRHVCLSFVRIDSPGLTSANMQRLSYARARRELYPLDRDTCWKRPQAVLAD